MNDKDTEHGEAEETNTQLQVMPQKTNDIISFESGLSAFSGSRTFELAQRMAVALASSTLVPDAYSRAKNPGGAIGNCLLALEIANRLNESPLLIMQNMVPVKGKLSWAATFLIGKINASGKFSRLRYEWKGTEGHDDWGCRAVATELATGKDLLGTWIDWKMVKGEGWSGRDGSKWKTMPEQMFQYRAATFWSRANTPELTLGFHSTDEMDDMPDVSGRPTRAPAAALNNKLKDQPEPEGTEGAKTAQEAPESTPAEGATEAPPAAGTSEGEPAAQPAKANKSPKKKPATTEPEPPSQKPAAPTLNLE